MGLVYLAFAVFLTLPVIGQLGSALLGDPRIDVWNHAWGYWFVADALSKGRLPYDTPLVGGPDGGLLYFIDTPGALVGLPLTLLFGPAAAYNLVLIGRIALAGFAAHQLAAELGAAPRSRWVAGLAYASSPFLLCELRNGISEVCATQWLVVVLWAASRVARRGSLGDWLCLGLAQGLCSLVTFYYGLISGLLAGLFILGMAIAQRRLPHPGRLLAGVGLALAMVLPHWLIFRQSLADPRALIFRAPELNSALMAHNAVDPRIFVMPGSFQSVDLAAVYGEPFLHTGYLRASLLALAGLALWKRPALRPWGLLFAVALVLGLGPYLWWNGEWLTVGGMQLSLPFEWIRRLMPEVAITHPLRFALGAHAIGAALAAVGLECLWGAVAERGQRAMVVGASALLVGESLFASAAVWPLPISPAEVPDFYAAPGEGMVLDLPVELGTSMETSRYFWYQTVHGRPIPYTPDVRLGSARDRLTFDAFHDPRRGGSGEVPRAPSGAVRDHIAQTYSLIVVHGELEARAGLSTSYVDALTQAFGPPERVGDDAIWRLPATR